MDYYQDVLDSMKALANKRDDVRSTTQPTSQQKQAVIDAAEAVRIAVEAWINSL